MKDYSMANKGKGFEEEVKISNIAYQNKGIAIIQKISTPWNVVRRGKEIVSAFPEGKSTLDFRGTVYPGLSVSFDCKETTEDKGLPLANMAPHQIDYMRQAIQMGETTFILCYIKPLDQRYFIDGVVVIEYWDMWQANKGKRGYNFIPTEEMKEIRSNRGILLDYLKPLRRE